MSTHSIPDLRVLDKPSPCADYLTIDQVAGKLGVSRRTVERRVRAGELPAIRLGPKLTRVEPAALRRYVEQRDTGRQSARAALRAFRLGTGGAR